MCFLSRRTTLPSFSSMAESAPTATIRRDTPSMADTRPELELALEFVWSIDLPYPDGQLLQCFLQDSIDPVQAAGYMLQRCYVEGDGRNLRTFVSDWKQLINVCMIDMFAYEGPTYQLHDKAVIANIIKRDRGRCCITGLGNSLWDPLVVARILRPCKIQMSERLYEMFGVFVGADLWDWVLSKAASSNVYRNHWLVRKSAAAALSEGFFQPSSISGD